MSSPSVHLAVLVVAPDPAKADLATAMVIRGRATRAGHQIVQQHVTKVMEAGIRSQLARWIDDADVDVILVTGAVEKDEVASALKPLVTQRLEGFTDLFRYLAFQELGAGAMLSNAEAAQCNSTFVFVLPGSVGAVGTAMDKLIIPQLDPNTEPKNLISSMPNLRKRADAVPAAIAPEKTQGGSGVAPKMPAASAGVRAKSATGKNIVRRAQDDPPTKQIDVAKLERQLALSSDRPNEAQTKPNIDLRNLLPRVPPGADDTLDTDTDVELLAAPPSSRGIEKRLETSPVIPPPSALPSIKGNAFNAKEGTSPGTASPSRTKPLTGPRPRPISVPPTNVFTGKEGTSPGTMSPGPGSARTRAPSGAVPAVRTREPGGAVPRTREQTGPYATPLGARAREPSGPQRADTTNADATNADPTTRTQAAPESGSTRAPSSPPPFRRTYAATPAVPMPVTRLPSAPRDPSKPISSGMLTPPSSAMFAAAAAGAATATTRAGGEAATTRAVGEEATTRRFDRDDAATTRVAKEAATTGSSDRDEAAASADEAATARKLGPSSAAAVSSRASSPSATSSVEMAPLVDAADLEEEPAPRKRQPTPPPPVVAPPRVRTSPAVAKAKPASFDDVVSTPTRTIGELPIGTFAYPEQRRRSGRGLKIFALLLAAGAGFAAVVFIVPKLTSHDASSSKAAVQTAQNDTTPTAPVPAPPPGEQPAPGDQATTPPAANPATGPATTNPPTGPATTNAATGPATTNAATGPATTNAATGPATTTPTPGNATTKPTTGTATTKPTPGNATTKPTPGSTTKPATGSTTKPPTGPVTKPDSTPVTKPDTTKPGETKPDVTETKPAPSGDPGCDEVACVLAKYDRPCCERYKPATTDLKPRAGNIPEELDRAMVRAGVEKIKPAVVSCGEKGGAKGTIKLAVRVTPDGSVTSAEVTETPDASLGACVAAAMKKAQFGKSVNGGSFTYPFVF